MTRRLVTPLSNYVDLGNGDFEMKDENIYGVLEKTHCLQAQVQDPETGITQIGTLIKLEVSWNHHRVPAVDFISPEDVAFVGFEDDLDSDDDEDLPVPLSSPMKQGIEKYIPIHRRPKESAKEGPTRPPQSKSKGPKGDSRDW